MTERTATDTEIDYCSRRREVSAFLRAHPEQHDQGVWYVPSPTPGEFPANVPARFGIAAVACALYVPVGEATFWPGELLFADGEIWDMDDYAQEALDLDDSQAMDIFNNLDNAEALAALEAA